MKRAPFKKTPFCHFKTQIAHHSLPDRFTFPYYYTPHPLASIAMNELQNELMHKPLFDIESDGKMFAVLVVRDMEGKVGYLCSFCEEGITVDASCYPKDFFVSPITSTLNSALAQNQQYHLQSQLRELIQSIDLQALQQDLVELQQKADKAIAKHQDVMRGNKKKRQQLRQQAELLKDEAKIKSIIAQLGQQSSLEKKALKQLKSDWQQKITSFNHHYNQQKELIVNKQQQLNEAESEWLITQHKNCFILNQHKEHISLYDLFNTTKQDNALIPLPHACEQNLPKLLQTAFQNNLKPVALGEFWWGKSPYDQIRQHKNLYPVCQSKCFEIVEYMLTGIALDDSPLEQTPSLNKELEIVYEDDALIVVNKPAEFLSVSGKYIHDSVHARVKARYPNATGPLIVHRLDMSTSGLLVLTLTAQTNRQVQQQFIDRSVKKRYTALLEGKVKTQQGTITLPMSGDLQDRPRQKICHQHGRSAITHYEVMSQTNNQTRIHLYPETGRTHQLRVHCAHIAGLNTPIVGDDLYGFKSDRLYLHAGYLKFKHPISQVDMEFQVDAPF